MFKVIVFWYNICYSEFSGRYDAVLQQFNDSVKMCQEQKALITQLEDDLRKVNALSVMFRGDAEVNICCFQVAMCAVPKKAQKILAQNLLDTLHI